MASELELLETGEMHVEGRMPWSSNATFLVTLSLGEQCTRAVYKPTKGERPLWDFPPGLHKREVAAHRLSNALGWDLVPPTVLRDGTFGEGSVQLFVDADFEQHYFTIHEQHPELHPQLRRLAAFDCVANNTDRKGGHCLLGLDGRLHAIDNGLCFGLEPKLRTVIWEFAGEPVAPDVIDSLEALAAAVPAEVAELLEPAEVEMIANRAAKLVRTGAFPVDRSGRAYPWPLV